MGLFTKKGAAPTKAAPKANASTAMQRTAAGHAAQDLSRSAHSAGASVHGILRKGDTATADRSALFSNDRSALLDRRPAASTHAHVQFQARRAARLPPAGPWRMRRCNEAHHSAHARRPDLRPHCMSAGHSGAGAQQQAGRQAGGERE